MLGLTAEDELLIKFNNSAQANAAKAKIQDFNKYNYAISCIDEIKLFEPIIIKNKDTENYKIKLVNYDDYEMNMASQRFFEKRCMQKDIKFKKTKYSDKITVYKIGSEYLNNVIDDDEIIRPLFIIEPMPVYRILLDSCSDENDVDIIYPDDNNHYTTVGVLDSGIANIKHLQPWLKEKWSPYPEELIDKSHGTMVSSVILYGDKLEGKDYSGTKGFYLLDANVFPDDKKETLYEDDLLRNIQEVVNLYGNKIKIWNLSLGISSEIDDNKFSDFGVSLDYLQDKYGIIICKSTGNCRNFMYGLPKGRINKGADSIRAVTVGSITHKKSSIDLVDINYPSPFTKIGRGPGYIIKPEVVHYGGNVGINSKGELIPNGVHTIGKDGLICSAIGTSFSTPRVTSIMAGLDSELDEEFDPLFIKALLIHSAQQIDGLDLPSEDKLKQIGFGIPQNINKILYNAPNEATLILRDTVIKGQYIDILDFPMPDCLIENENYNGQIILTLVYNPILDASQGDEYCQSNIDVFLGTYDEKVDRDTSKVNILNPIGRNDSKNLLNPDCYSKTKLNQNINEFSRRERFLIKYGDKFYPIKKYAADLTDLTESYKAKYLGAGRKWFMKIEGLFRENIEREAQINEITLNQEFCLIVTIRHPNPSIPVYNEVTQKLDEYNFWHNNIKTKTRVDINIGTNNQ